MQIGIWRGSKQSGGTLLVVLAIACILSVSVMAYLSVVEQQSLLGSRSQSWNVAIAVAEAGIEEGMQHLNNNFTNLAADGWTQSGNAYWRTNSLGDGHDYVVHLSVTNPSVPVIVSRGHANAASFARIWPSAFFAAVGGGGGGASGQVSRAVRVTCSKGGLFRAALVAKHLIDLKGNGVLTDSFNSGDTNKSSNGLYDPTKFTGDKGDVATNDGMTSPIGVNNANIYGVAHTGPGGLVSVGSNGGVGDHAWQASHPGQVQEGWWRQDSNFTFPDTSFPYTSTGGGVVAPMSGTVITSSNVTEMTTASYPVTGTYIGLVRTNYSKKKITGYSYTLANMSTVYYTNTYDNVIEAGQKYYVNHLMGSTIVTGPGATLVVASGIDLTQPFTILHGASILVYSGGNEITLTGNQMFNQDGFAGSFILYCAPSVTEFTLDGNGQFTGVLVAPNVDINLNGGGTGDQDFVGALMVNSVSLNGHFKFHYDEALEDIMSNGRFLVTSWNEIP